MNKEKFLEYENVTLDEFMLIINEHYHNTEEDTLIRFSNNDGRDLLKTKDMYYKAQEFIDYINEKCSYNFKIITDEYPYKVYNDENSNVWITFANFNKLHEKWFKLHQEIVDKVINFCKENNIVASEFGLNADGLEESIPHGEWTSATDSSFVLAKMNEDYTRSVILSSY